MSMGTKKSAARLWRAVRSLLAVVVITLAVLLGLARAVYPMIAEQREQIQLWASEAAGRPVRIARVAVAVEGLAPQFTLYGLSLMGDEGRIPLLELEEVRVTLSMWESLREWRLAPSEVVVVGPEFAIERTASGELQLMGLTTEGADLVDSRALYGWLLARPRLEIENARIRWQGRRSADDVLQLEGVDFLLSNIGEEHRLTGRVATAADSAEGLLEFEWVLHGGLRDELPWHGSLHLLGRGVQLGRLPYIRDYLSGGFSGEAWLSHSDFAFDSVVLNLAAEEWLVRGESAEELVIESLNGRISWARQEQGWQLQLHQFAAEIGGRAWPESSLDLVLKRDDAGGQQLTLEGDHLDLAAAEVAGNWFAGRFGWASLPVTDLVGSVRGFSGAVSQDAQEQLVDYAFSGGFEQVGWRGHGSLPSIMGLGGTVVLNREGGRGELQSGAMVVDFPNQFDQPIPLHSGSGALVWQQLPGGGWSLKAPAIKLRTEELAAAVAVELTWLGGDDSAEIDLLAEFDDLPVTRVQTYLPMRLFGSALGEWFESALVGGELSDTTLRIRGPLNGFPYTSGGGLFEVRGRVNNGTLRYQADWPRLEGLEGALVFDGAGMQGQFAQGRVLQTQLREIDVALPFASGQRLLKVNGLASGPNSSYLQFLAESPLGDRFSAVADALQLAGDGELNLALRIPIDDGEGYGVGGLVELAGVDLTVPAAALQIGQLRGQIGFSDEGVWAEGLRGELLGGDVAVDLSTRGGVTELQASGEVDGAALQDFLGLEGPPVLLGAVPWQGVLALGPARSTLTLESSLQGVALQAPLPVGKSARGVLPLRLTAEHET